MKLNSLLKKQAKLWCLLVFCNMTLPMYAGFDARTLIKKPNAFVYMQDVAVGDCIASCHIDESTDNYECVLGEITYLSNSIERKAVYIALDGEQIIASVDQKFYLPKKRRWVQAKNLKSGDLLLCASKKLISILDVREVEKEVKMF